MAETNTTGTPKNPASRTTTATRKTTAAQPRKSAAKKGAAKDNTAVTNTATINDTPATTGTGPDNRAEAKSRFNAALEEAKAGAAALRAEAGQRAGAYREQARGRSESWASDAKTYGNDAKTKGRELATEGKVKASEGIRSLGQLVSENAHYVDERLGAKYGDYARTASKSLSDTADRLDQKSIDDLGEDAREFVRKSPGLAVGIAAVAGFMLSRLFRRSR